MSQEKRTVKIIMSLEIETNKPIQEVRAALERGIYRGLDTSPFYVAQPKDVKININDCQEG